MFWLRPSVSDDMRSWILDCFDWFDDVFEPPLSPIVPTKAFFNAPKGRDLSTAKLVLEDVKRHMKYAGDVQIFPLNVLPVEYRHDYQATSAVAGTFENTDSVSVIRYDPHQMDRPIGFINLIAHELMHGRLSGYENAVPGGEAAHELATDLGCIIAGFGTFQLQAADDAGWFGYMTQESRAFALAVFLERRGLGIETVTPWLSAKCTRFVRRACKEL